MLKQQRRFNENMLRKLLGDSRFRKDVDLSNCESSYRERELTTHG